MKKLLTVLFLITSATMLYAEAPELKNMMPNSWQKVTRLTEQEEAEFLRKDAQQLAKSNPADRTGRSGVFEES